MLCAGIVRRPGWKVLDAKGGDFVARIPPLPSEVKEVKWDVIEWIHGVTSFYPWEALGILKEIYGVLSTGGMLILEQPDFRKAIESGRVEWLFGDPVPRDPLHMNHWAYTPETLRKVLEEAGFSDIRLFPAQHHFPDRDFRMEAYR